MKKIITKTFVLLLVAGLLSSCNMNMLNSVSGNKNVTIQDRSSKNDFTKIKASNGLDVYLTQGSKNEVTVEADENLQEIIITEIENGTLKIYAEKNIWSAKAKKIFVTIKDLESLSATSGVHVNTDKTIQAKNISIISTSGAVLDVSIDANYIETIATSGSQLRISGITNNHSANATSGASIDAYELESKNGNAKVTSGANIKMYASESMDAIATSGGDVDFKGKPAKVVKRSSSGGSISAK